MITILCPSRGRPDKFKRMVKSARDTAANPDNVNVMCFIGMDEKYLNEYKSTDKRTMLFVGQSWSAVMASNYLATRVLEYYPDTRLYMVGADDMVFFTPGWDKALLDHYDSLEQKIHVYSLLDSRSPSGKPHPIVTREYVQAMGYFLPPIFLHWFVDSWTVKIAQDNCCFSHFVDYLLIHDKPSDKGVCDETHKRIRDLGWHERDRYVNDTCQHFLMMETERLGKHLQLQAGTREHVD